MRHSKDIIKAVADSKQPPDLKKAGDAAVKAALASWKAGVGEHARETLDPIFATAGWSARAPRYPMSVPEWCGFAAYYWLNAAGMYKAHATSFFHVKNVVAFFTYGKQHFVNARRYMSHAVVNGALVGTEQLHSDHGCRRLWWGHDAIQDSIPDIQPGDVVLIRHRPTSSIANHITLALTWAPEHGTLVTIEGNASGVGVNGPTREAVVKVTRPLGIGAIRRMIWGIGRPSALDYQNHIVTDYVR